MGTTSTADLLLHPVRLRVLQALLGDRRMTTSDLRAELSDVAPATLYRHVGALVRAGVLEVVETQRVRGAVERTYALRLEGAQVSADDLAAMSPDDHRQAFMAFVAGLLADFDRYLARGHVDLSGDGVGYRQTALWLDDDELAELVTELRAVVAARSALQPDGSRTRRLLSTVLMPAP